jgi:hypothetical protein
MVIEVQDTGAGITPDAIGTIFNAFDQGGQSAARNLGGLGLGLAISKAVVDLHEGQIRAESDGRDRGARFPLSCRFHADLKKTGESLKSKDAHKPEGNRLRILLVDDHMDTLKALRRLARSSGHAVTAAATVREAEEAAQSSGFDILISDIGPDGTGPAGLWSRAFARERGCARRSR